MNKSLLILILLTSVFLTSCITTPVSITSSNTPLVDKKITENLGKVKGSDRAFSVFCLWMIKKPDIEKAVANALKQKGGDALINVKCYEKSMYFLLFSIHKVIVEGEAIKFVREAREEFPRK